MPGLSWAPVGWLVYLLFLFNMELFFLKEDQLFQQTFLWGEHVSRVWGGERMYIFLFHCEEVIDTP